MDRLPNYLRQPYGAGSSTRPQRTSRSNVNYKEPDIHDDRESVSGSDDGSYATFQDSSKHEGEQEHAEGHDVVLTSQTLNADGTPKRPMNAFMIFARRRRPQVSSEHQSMRTGEISKLLSKEWSSMAASEKQYYQDQAKMLKDTFNTKYPDYVYRRRPNNSRRRRRDAQRPDGAGDTGEDGVSVGDFESPTDGDEHYDGAESSYSRGSHEPPAFGDPLKYPPSSSIPRSSGFQSSHHLYRGADQRLPYPSASERQHHGLGHRLSNPSLNYSLSSSSSSYSSDLGSPQTWHPRLDRGPSGWSSGQERGPPPLKTGNYPGSSGSGWSSGLHGSSSSSHYSTSSSSNFPTLNTPFFPSQASMSEYSNISNSSNSSHYDSSLSLQPLERSSPSTYDSRGGSLGEPLTYPASRGLSRVLPPVASISGYPSQLHSTSPTLSSSSQYWSRS